MNACKSHQRQIALLAVQALDESERTVVVEHLRECSACRLYAEQLQVVVGLYTEDADRTIAPVRNPVRRFAPEPIPWYAKSRGPVLAAAAVLVVCAAMLLMNRRPAQDIAPAVGSVAPVKPKSPMVLSIGNSRHLTLGELENLAPANPSQSATRTEFVFSVRTRDDGS